MEYKGYKASVEFSADDRVFYGVILGIQDKISFEGTSVDELEGAFREAVDDYLELCESIGKKPDRAYSGQIPLRISGELHRKIFLAAESERSSLNAWIADKLEWLTSREAKGQRV